MSYIKRKSLKQERRTAKEFEGKTQIASGALEFAKADVRTGERTAGEFNNEDFLIENKFTDSNSYKLTLATWNKVSKEAFRDNFRTPLMQIDIKDLHLVVMDKDTAKVFGVQMTKYHPSEGKSYSMSYKTMGNLFGDMNLEEVLVVSFIKENQQLYIMSKDDFLRKLG